MFRYRLHSPNGDDLGEATYAIMIKLGEEILLGAGRRFRVLDVVPFAEEDESPLVGMLKIEATSRRGPHRATGPTEMGRDDDSPPAPETA